MTWVVEEAVPAEGRRNSQSLGWECVTTSREASVARMEGGMEMRLEGK